MDNALAETKKARTALNDDLIVADAPGDVADDVGGPRAVLKIQALMPIPAVMSDELMWELRTIYDDLVETKLDAAPYVAVVSMNRPGAALGKPFSLPLAIARQTSRHADRADRYRAWPARSFSAASTRCRPRSAPPAIPISTPTSCCTRCRQFSELSAAVTKEIEDPRRNGDWGQRLIKDRTQLGGVMEAFMDRARRKSPLALPMQRGRARAPISASRSMRKSASPWRCVAFAWWWVAAPRRCRRFRRQAEGCHRGIGHSYLRRYNEDVVKELRDSQNRHRRGPVPIRHGTDRDALQPRKKRN